MANCFIPNGWPQEVNLDQCQAEIAGESSLLVPWHPFSTEPTPFQRHGNSSWAASFEGFAEDRSGCSSKSHSEAEKRRRDRINAQLAILRKLIPKSDKMDKAALLSKVVERVKDLKRKASELSKVFTVPSDIDEVIVDCNLDKEAGGGSSIDGENNTQNSNNILIKASVCCDDRPELFAELSRAIKGLKLTAVKADMSSMGGRVRSILVLCSSSKDNDERVCINKLRQSLKVVLSRIVGSSSTVGSGYRLKSKRQRSFFPSYC